MAAVKIKGLEALRESLKEFPAKVQQRATNTGVRKASSKLTTVLRRAAYAAPLAKGYKRTGKLRRSLRAQVGKTPANKGKAWVGLKKAPGEKRVLNYYKTLEFGRSAYTSKGRGAVAGNKPLRPFFMRAWLASRATIGSILVTETEKALIYEAAKAYGRSKGKR